MTGWISQENVSALLSFAEQPVIERHYEEVQYG